MLMIWSSLARNRSPSSVVFGFFGRIVPSDATPNHAQRFEGISNMKSQASGALALKSLQSRRAVAQKNRIRLRHLTVLHGQLIRASSCLQAFVSRRLGTSTLTSAKGFWPMCLCRVAQLNTLRDAAN